MAYCVACSNATACTTCDSTHHGETCWEIKTSCDAGYYLDDKKCVECATDCEWCTAENQCTDNKCKSGMGWSTNKCVACTIGDAFPANGHNCFTDLNKLSMCNEGFMVETEEKITCVACAENCAWCDTAGAGKCDTCMAGWTVDKEDEKCIACSTGCMMCTSGCAAGCVACHPDAGDLDDDCACAEGYEYNETTWACDEIPDVISSDDSGDKTDDGETDTTTETTDANILKFTQFCMIALILVLSYMI